MRDHAPFTSALSSISGPTAALTADNLVKSSFRGLFPIFIFRDFAPESTAAVHWFTVEVSEESPIGILTGIECTWSEPKYWYNGIPLEWEMSSSKERENPCRADGVVDKDSSMVSKGEPSDASFFAEINAALQEAKDSVQPWRGVDSPIPDFESEIFRRNPVLEVRVPKEVEKGLLRVRENSRSEIIIITNATHQINFFENVGRVKMG